MNATTPLSFNGSIAPQDRLLIEAIEHGLPIVSRPYAEIAEKLNVSEQAVIARLQTLIDSGAIRRYGVVVRHRELGYTANGMVVWDVPDSMVGPLGIRIGKFSCVTLSYRRPRHLPDWPYNLFTMVHGRDTREVTQQVEGIIHSCDLREIDYRILFSTRRFKQCGARYSRTNCKPQSVDRAPYARKQATISKSPGGHTIGSSHKPEARDAN